MVVERGERARVELARDDRAREISDVAALLPSEPGASEVGLGEGRDALGRHDAGEPLQPSIGGAPGREGDLLLEDYLHESLEPRRAIPEGRRSMPRDHRSEMRIPPRKLSDALSERVGSQLQHYILQTD